MISKTEHCARRLLDHGFWAYYFGETTREMLMRKKPTEFHLFTNADLIQISKLFSEVVFRKECDEQAFLTRDENTVHFFISDFPMDRVVRIPGLLEVERQACIHAVNCCLFRIDGVFYDCKRKIFFDPLDAYTDIKNGTIGTVQTPQEAAARYPTIALKTARVRARTGFHVEKSLMEFLRKGPASFDYRNPSCSIINDFIALLLSQWVYEALILLDEFKILDQILPELSVLKKVNQDKDHHPEGNGFWHTLECVKFVKKPNRALMMAILLHDTGKAIALSDREKHKPFPNHSSKSGKIARGVLQRFDFSPGEVEEIQFLVRNHMILNAIDRLPEARLRKLFLSPYFPNLLELYRADLQSGYHSAESYYQASRSYREFLKKERMRREGVYA